MNTSRQWDSVKSFFDKDSSRYLGDRYPSEAKTSDQYSYLSRRAAVFHMLNNLTSSDRLLLDIGCGPGVYTRDLLLRKWRVCGVDLSSGMLKQALRSLADMPANKAACFAVSELSRLPFGESSFGVVICIGVVSYVPNIREALAEIWRVITPGGYVIFQISNANSLFEFEVWMRNLLRAHLSRSSNGSESPHEHMQLTAYKLNVFEQLCREAGFEKLAHCYYDFRIPIIRQLAPGIALALSKKLEHLNSLVELPWLGSGVIETFRKSGH